ncbi:MAG: diguanylate cyclase [Gammaproteobacteria bacterium]|nr:MAG: diguanylate cyclase [Gammaproteobacteria bacterium]
MYLLANILFLSGICLYAASLFTVQQLVKRLPLGEVRNNWKVLSFFIVGFIVGYAAYLFMLWTGKIALTSITLSSICFAASAFVLLLCFLTYQTTRDISEAIAMDQASIIDPILDIYNRRYFDRRIDEETQRSRRYNQPLSIILFEVDELESIAKKNGRLVGDVVLRKISDFLVESVRSSDIVARYDEHKIVVATTQTKPDMAIMLADRLRGEIERLEVLPNNEKSAIDALHVTVTAGVSCVEDRIKSGFDLTDVAEKAMKRANSEGHNRVYAYDPSDLEVSEPVIEATAAA